WQVGSHGRSVNTAGDSCGHYNLFHVFYLHSRSGLAVSKNCEVAGLRIASRMLPDYGSENCALVSQ
ncbi:MAG: hypothetical protein WBC47_05280, partial [Dehalococcoidia bacterium]